MGDRRVNTHIFFLFSSNTHARSRMSSQLKPLRYPQGDLFVIDALDVIIKDDMPSMEYPFYSLSKKPDREVRRFEYKDSWIEFRPSIKGLPTIYDKDLIIYAISHLVSALDEGQDPPKEVEIDPYYFFLFTQRGTGGREYDALRDSLDRLDGTRFRTNISVGDTMKDDWQGIIDKASLTTSKKTGKPEKLRITLSDMVLDTIKQRNVLTLNRDYFRLKKPIERRIYELARKHVGQKDCWVVGLKTLHLKSGSRSSLREFRRATKSLIEHNHLPDFDLAYNAEKDQITFFSKKKYLIALSQADSSTLPPLPAWVYEKAKKLAPMMDVYALEEDWRLYWSETGKKDLENPSAAFLGFCKKTYSDSR